MGLNPGCLPRLCISIVHLASLVKHAARPRLGPKGTVDTRERTQTQTLQYDESSSMFDGALWTGR